MTLATAIVVPISHPSEAERVVDTTVEIARALGASITLLHVSETPNHMVAIVPGATIDGDVASDRAQAEAELDALVRGVRAAGFERVSRAVIMAPTVAQGIIDFVRVSGSDLIVMGTHGRSGLSRLVIGSYTEDLFRLGPPCPVMTIHIP